MNASRFGLLRKIRSRYEYSPPWAIFVPFGGTVSRQFLPRLVQRDIRRFVAFRFGTDQRVSIDGIDASHFLDDSTKRDEKKKRKKIHKISSQTDDRKKFVLKSRSFDHVIEDETTALRLGWYSLSKDLTFDRGWIPSLHSVTTRFDTNLQ